MFYFCILQFDNDINLSGSNGPSSLTSETLKLLQRNMGTYDCSLPTSPNSSSTGMCARYFRGSQQLSDLNHNYEANSTSSLFGGNQSLSRSNSPPDNDQSSLLYNFDSANILDMINYLAINQQHQNGHNQHHYGSSSGSNSNNSNSTNSNSQSTQSQYSQMSNQNQFYQHQSQGGSSFGNGSCNSQSGNNGGSGGGGNSFVSDYERLQNLQALNTLRLLQQSQQLSQLQLQQYQFNQLLPNYNNTQVSQCTDVAMRRHLRLLVLYLI